MASTPGRISLRQIRPGGAGPQNPEDSIEYGPPILGRSSRLAGSGFGFRNELYDTFPLFIGQVHESYIGSCPGIFLRFWDGF
jgi:hypothetical protein